MRIKKWRGSKSTKDKVKVRKRKWRGSKSTKDKVIVRKRKSGRRKVSE